MVIAATGLCAGHGVGGRWRYRCAVRLVAILFLMKARCMATARDLRVNDQIRIPTVRVIDAEGQQLGIMPTVEAMDHARDAGLDLVEVAPNSRPPVCRILDYGKFKYEQKKKKTQKKVHVTHVKEIRVRPKTDRHDVEVKVNRARGFLERKDKVRVCVRFRGREMAFISRGREILESMAQMLEDIAKLERPPAMEGPRMAMTLTPRAPDRTPAKRASKPKPKAEAEPKPEPTSAATPEPAPAPETVAPAVAEAGTGPETVAPAVAEAGTAPEPVVEPAAETPAPEPTTEVPEPAPTEDTQKEAEPAEPTEAPKP